MTEQPDWTPAFPGQRPPFQPGHTLSLRHGARSPRVVDPLADSILQRAVEDAPWLSEPKYAATVRAWARAEAQAELLTAWLDEHGLHDEEGRLRYAEQALHRAETRAMNLRSRLGLDPISRARLGQAAQGQGPTIFDYFAALEDQADTGTDDDGSTA